MGYTHGTRWTDEEITEKIIVYQVLNLFYFFYS